MHNRFNCLLNSEKSPRRINGSLTMRLLDESLLDESSPLFPFTQKQPPPACPGGRPNQKIKSINGKYIMLLSVTLQLDDCFFFIYFSK